MENEQMGVKDESINNNVDENNGVGNGIDVLIDDGESQAIPEPPSEEESESLPQETENKDEVSSEEDVKTNDLDNKQIPYPAFKEKVEQINVLKSEIEALKNTLNNPDELAKKLSEYSQNKQSEQVSEETLDSLDAINKRLAKLDRLDFEDDDYEKEVYRLQSMKDQIIKNEIFGQIEEREKTAELVSEQKVILDRIFDGRDAEREKLEAHLVDWVNKNPGAKFPLYGERGWRLLDEFINGKDSSLYKQGKMDAINSHNSKKLVSEVGSKQPAMRQVSPNGTGIDILFADKL